MQFLTNVKNCCFVKTISIIRIIKFVKFRQKGENIDGKSDKEKIDLLKNIISDMVTQKDREDIIKGKNNGESQ